ncbi:glucose-6-phosphate isomerase, partial [Acidimicrobiaceae bacterium]|nr:glucose-6-phosphate isomerase [Acidimicrobiaceae bacterium]
QHSFFQALHQGTETMPIDLIGFARLSDKANDEIIANLIAQAQTLAFGQDHKEDTDSFSEYEILPGSRPSTVILAPELSPNILGQLIALYEHRTVATGVVWGINPFDQWGVEYGKKSALKIISELKNSEVSSNHDSSTKSLITRYMHWRND